MKTLTISDLNKLIVTIHGRSLKDTIAVIQSFNELRTTVPFSVFQEAIEQYNSTITMCCAEKRQAEVDYKSLLKAIVELDKDLKSIV